MIQKAGQGIAEHRIMLVRFGPDREVHRTQVKRTPRDILSLIS